MLDREIRPVLVAFFELTRAPDADDLAAVGAGDVRDIFEIGTTHRVAPAIDDRVADERLEMVFPFEKASLDAVVVAVKKHPVVFGFKRGRVVIRDSGVANHAVVGLELDHGAFGDRTAVKPEAVDRDMGGVDFQRRRPAQLNATGRLRPDNHRVTRLAAPIDDDLYVVPRAVLERHRIARARRLERRRKLAWAFNEMIPGRKRPRTRRDQPANRCRDSKKAQTERPLHQNLGPLRLIV